MLNQCSAKLAQQIEMTHGDAAYRKTTENAGQRSRVKPARSFSAEAIAVWFSKTQAN